MRVDDLRAARRPEAEWEPFMDQLRARMRRRRRARLANWAAAAALVIAAASGFWVVSGPRPPQPSLRADVPASSEPVFSPSSGTGNLASRVWGDWLSWAGPDGLAIARKRPRRTGDVATWPVDPVLADPGFHGGPRPERSLGQVGQERAQSRLLKSLILAGPLCHPLNIFDLQSLHCLG